MGVWRGSTLKVFKNLTLQGFVDTISIIFFFSIQREKKNILELLKRRQDAQEQELKQNLKLEQDVEMEKLRKVEHYSSA